MTSSNRSKNLRPDTPQKPGILQFVLIMLITMILFQWYMRTFHAPADQDLKKDSSISEVRLEIEKQEQEPEEPAVTPDVSDVSDVKEVTPAGVAPAEAVKEGEVIPAAEVEKKGVIPEKLISLGSLDTSSPYRMLVTFTSRGAAVATVEMNEKRLISMSDAGDFQGGYLGVLNFRSDEEDTVSVAGMEAQRTVQVRPQETVISSTDQVPDPITNEMRGCHVDVIGAGTPAEVAGLKVGDIITKLDDVKIHSNTQLQEILITYAPGREVGLTVWRDGRFHTIFAKLGRQPVKVIAPENGDPLSFLTTFSHFGKQKLDSPYAQMGERIAKTDTRSLYQYLDFELPNIQMRKESWEVESQEADSVTFLYRMPRYGMEVRKTYKLSSASEEQLHDPVFPAYHLTMKVEVKNVGSMVREVAIQQDGPTGLPTEGYWFCSKTARGMFEMVGIRDVITGYSDSTSPTITSCKRIVDGEWGLYEQNSGNPLKYIGVDAQYFSAIMLPQPVKDKNELGVKEYTQLRVGEVPDPWEICTDTSVRLRSEVARLNPGESAGQEFKVFIGPKRPELLSKYELDNVVYYGWFSPIAKFLSSILHFFYGIFGNYGIAIILLTVLVRLAMFPLSRKQVKGALIMQKLQPEMKKITEKYEDPMERQKAQMELFRKYNYNPMTGCWVLFIQLPIFIALYRSLLVDVELRQAPLISDAIRFCSNLAAPDMMFYWKPYVWEMISSGYGFFGLGPYLNLLPILTIIIFIVQQKMLMPPALDDQARLQQNIMKYMMVFMGFIFFKVPSGLCIYFVASSLWGLAERQLMPKTDPQMDAVPSIIDVGSKPVKKETFMEKVVRMAKQQEVPKQETPAERKKRRAKSK
ncbi:MAG: YidC/Oxa1 family insertase periplasmic-domain containing protein [Planctomycetia bacterium]|nr:YidC/Oxa1 family insertase periplasmic-domain containing protein [Planctomycetia bacterium]